MGNHSKVYMEVTGDDTMTGIPLHAARCKCGWYSGKLGTKQQVEDAVMKHDTHIDRVRAYLGTATPSLKQQRDYYLEMANSSETPEAHRPIWQQLASELSVRLGDGIPKWDQEQLPW